MESHGIGPLVGTGAPDRGYIDFHNLIRINGVWKITNKTATHSSRSVRRCC